MFLNWFQRIRKLMGRTPVPAVSTPASKSSSQQKESRVELVLASPGTPETESAEPSKECLTTAEIEIVFEKRWPVKGPLPKDSKTLHLGICGDCATRLFERLYPNRKRRRRSA